MTGPRLKRTNHGKGHSYKIDGVKVPSVTRAIGMLDKPALINWAAETTAGYAVDNWDELGGLPPSERLKKLTKARWNVNKEATERGTKIHALGARLVHGEEVDVPDWLRGPVEGYARFMDEWDITPVGIEAPCCHTRYRYAGTLDAVVDIGKLDVRALVDLKSGKGVYNDTTYQLSGYRGADLWQPDGLESEQPMPEVEAVFVAHIMSDSTRLVPVETDWDAAFRRFLYLLDLKRAADAWDDEPPILPAIYPEDYS